MNGLVRSFSGTNLSCLSAGTESLPEASAAASAPTSSQYSLGHQYQAPATGSRGGGKGVLQDLTIKVKCTKSVKASTVKDANIVDTIFTAFEEPLDVVSSVRRARTVSEPYQQAPPSSSTDANPTHDDFMAGLLSYDNRAADNLNYSMDYSGGRRVRRATYESCDDLRKRHRAEHYGRSTSREHHAWDAQEPPAVHDQRCASTSKSPGLPRWPRHVFDPKGMPSPTIMPDRRDLAYEDPNGSQGALRISPFVFSPRNGDNRPLPSKDDGIGGSSSTATIGSFKTKGPATDLPNLAFEADGSDAVTGSYNLGELDNSHGGDGRGACSMLRMNSSTNILRNLSWLDFAQTNCSRGSLSGMGGSRGSLNYLCLDSSVGSRDGMCSAPMLHYSPDMDDSFGAMTQGSIMKAAAAAEVGGYCY